VQLKEGREPILKIGFHETGPEKNREKESWVMRQSKRFKDVGL